jgi:prepilin-type N-terminal cleavage/methylation domain-containing protein
MCKYNSKNKLKFSLIFSRNRKNQGFSLLEITIALAILGFVLYGLTSANKTIRDFDKYAQNKVIMQDARLALLTFVQVNGYLPCPDTDGDGRENRATSGNFQCTDDNDDTTLPFLDIGTVGVDIWNQPFYYAVNHKADNDAVLINTVGESASFFSNQGSGQVVFDFSTPPFGGRTGDGSYSICSEVVTTCDSSTDDTDKLEQAAIAVVISFGANGAETWAGSASLGSAEAENRDFSTNYYWQGIGSNVTDDGDGNSLFFDDQIVWLSGYDVKYAVVKSGRVLPYDSTHNPIP